MHITLNLVSSICWEIITKRTIRMNVANLPLFKDLLDSVYELFPTIFDQSLRIYWRYSPKDFLEIADHFSFCTFLNLMAEPDLYLIIGDAEKFYSDTEKFLRILDLMELKRVKELERNKYVLKSEADEIEEQIQKRQESLANCSSFIFLELEPSNADDRVLLHFALRNMPTGRCYTADICSEYNLIDCLRKGWPRTKKVLAPLPDEVIERKNKKHEPKSKNDFQEPRKVKKKK